MSDKDATAAHWSASVKLMLQMLAVWAFFSFVIHFFAGPLNGIKIIGFPMGAYMAGQGSLIVFVVMLFWFAKAQDKVDRDHGFDEVE